MRAVTIREKELSVSEHPDPVAGAGEVLVRVHSAGLNGADMMQRRGLYPAPAGSPAEIPGLALGDGAERFAVGDRVMAIVGGGEYLRHPTRVRERERVGDRHQLSLTHAG